MSTAAKPDLKIQVSSLGPVAKLDAQLSKYSQNLIYARNGTGKSFITRALRCLDLYAQGHEVTEAAAHLVSEESQNGLGSFSLIQGQKTLATLSLNSTTSQVHAQITDHIFHVFSDDFVHAELRQNDYNIDGNIETQITLDQTIIDTKEAEEKYESAQKTLGKLKLQLQDHLEKLKLDELVSKAAINKRLKDFTDIGLESILSTYTSQPDRPSRTFKEILNNLDELKSVPAEPDYPKPIEVFSIDFNKLDSIHKLVEKITSPSTISDEIKSRMSTHPDFFEAGVNILEKEGHKNCPFCHQSVLQPPAKDRIELYIAYYTDAEGKHKQELRAAWQEIKLYRTTLQSRITTLSHQGAKYAALKKFIPSQKNIELPDIIKISEEIELELTEYAKIIEAKGKSPSAPIKYPTSNLIKLSSDLNKKINEINSLFENLSKAVLTSDTERKNLQREACHAFKIEFVHENWAAVSTIRQSQQSVSNAETELSNLKKSQLSTSVKERVAESFEILIASFFGTKYTFDKENFTLKRENKKMVRGPSRTLSDGEKTAIAFCYFIACAHKKVKAASDYAKLYLVFDDPITSMSYDFVFAIAQTLKNMSISTSGDISINPAAINKGHSRPDLMIFTHSSYFYNICVTNRVIKEDAAFFLHKAGEIHILSKLSKYIAPFEQHLREIFDVHGGHSPSHTTGNAIRCVIEAVGRFCHPDKCDSLSTYISYLAGEEGIEIKSVLINNLCHGTYYDETPSPDEIREACTETIGIVEKYAKGQLELVRSLHANIPTQTKSVAA